MTIVVRLRDGLNRMVIDVEHQEELIIGIVQLVLWGKLLHRPLLKQNLTMIVQHVDLRIMIFVMMISCVMMVMIILHKPQSVLKKLRGRFRFLVHLPQLLLVVLLHVKRQMVRRLSGMFI